MSRPVQKRENSNRRPTARPCAALAGASSSGSNVRPYCVAAERDFARVRRMSDVAAKPGLFATATDDAAGGGAASPRIGTGILPYQTLLQMVRARDIKGFPQPVEPEQ